MFGLLVQYFGALARNRVASGPIPGPVGGKIERSYCLCLSVCFVSVIIVVCVCWYSESVVLCRSASETVPT